MSVNSSSSNDSLLHPHLSLIECYVTRPSSFIFTTYITTYVFLLLPLCIFVIYHGLQQWWKKRSTSSAAPVSHSDSFTYHMVAMEMIGVLGCVLFCCGIYRVDSRVILVGRLLLSFTLYGEVFCHLLTCVERYLAVVHPITYLSLRRERGVRIRNITIGCVWLLCFVLMSIKYSNTTKVNIVDFCLLILSFIITSFCSLSVLRVLIRPGPGEQGGGRERVDQSRLRAFYIIAAILAVLVLRFAAGLVWSFVHSPGPSHCMTRMGLFWCNLPSSLALPLLFVHRDGKLVCRKKNLQ